jgi:hypothetical protein
LMKLSPGLRIARDESESLTSQWRQTHNIKNNHIPPNNHTVPRQT